MIRSTPLALLALFILACEPAAPARPSESPEQPPPPAGSYEVPPAPPSEAGTAEAGPGEVATGPHLVVETVEGAELAQTSAIFAGSQRKIQECVPGSSGVIRVRVERRGGGRVEMTVEPGTTLLDTERRCILESLSTLKLDEIRPIGVPSDKAAGGFTALLRIEW